MNILVTGGLGYIGSHISLLLLEKGYDVTIIDNLENSSRDILTSLNKLSSQKAIFYQADMRDGPALEQIFRQHNFTMVIHCAGLKSVADSMVEPLRYYDYNVAGSVSLLKVMARFGVKKMVFSSSATVYGLPQYLPYDENHPTNPVNVYGQSKYMVENILGDLAHSDKDWQITILRYFNPVGAHPSGVIGEIPKDRPNNLMPFIAQVAAEIRPILTIHGDDYDTKDGSAIRDYIHVMDLAKGHLQAIEHMRGGVNIYNLGAGRGLSVFEVLRAFEESVGRKLPHRVGPRRAGDLPAFYASAAKAKRELAWQTEKSLAEMCQDMWRFQQQQKL